MRARRAVAATLQLPYDYHCCSATVVSGRSPTSVDLLLGCCLSLSPNSGSGFSVCVRFSPCSLFPPVPYAESQSKAKYSNTTTSCVKNVNNFALKNCIFTTPAATTHRNAAVHLHLVGSDGTTDCEVHLRSRANSTQTSTRKTSSWYNVRIGYFASCHSNDDDDSKLHNNNDTTPATKRYRRVRGGRGGGR